MVPSVIEPVSRPETPPAMFGAGRLAVSIELSLSGA